MSPKSELRLEGGDYAPVAVRISLFYERFPDGRITTRLLSYAGGRVVVQAMVYRSHRTRRPAATGLASEHEGDGDVNAVACLENTETSAIGRALANFGITASTHRPSREEMDKAARAAVRLDAMKSERVPPPRSHSSVAARGQSQVEHHRNAVGVDEALQARADAVAEVLRLLTIAQELGLDPTRASRMRTGLLGGQASLEVLQRTARGLRRWLEAARRRRIAARAVSDAPSAQGKPNGGTSTVSPPPDSNR